MYRSAEPKRANCACRVVLYTTTPRNWCALSLTSTAASNAGRLLPMSSTPSYPAGHLAFLRLAAAVAAHAASRPSASASATDEVLSARCGDEFASHALDRDPGAALVRVQDGARAVEHGHAAAR